MSAFVTLKTTSPSARILPLLEGVIATGKGWNAFCPCCAGKSRTLSLAEGDNGTLLLNCFKCRDTTAIVAAIGLQMGDLFQRKDLRSMTPGQRSQFKQASLIPRWNAALNVVVNETTVMQIALNKVLGGEALAEDDLTRLHVAALRIFDAREVLSNGR